MADLQQQLIWLGAGSAAEPALDFASFSKVTLIDARAEATQALSRQYSQANNIQVITQAVAASSTAASLQLYNLATFAALSPATGLTQLFPGLKASQTENLTTKSINDLVSELALSGNQHTLVLDIPDQALSLLQALQSQQQLSLFTTIYLQYSNDELYTGMAPFSQVEAFFKQHYFALKQTDNTDPDLPVYCFTLDAAAKDVALLKHQLKTLTEKLASAEGQLSQAQQQAAAEKKHAEQANSELTAQLEQAKQQAAAEQQQAEQTKAELTKQLEQAKQQAAAEQQQAEQAKAELTKQLEQAKQQAAAEKQQAEQAKAELTKQLEHAKQQAASEKQQAEQTKAELTKQLEGAKHQLSTEQKQASEKVEQIQKQAAEQKLETEQKFSSLTTQLTNTVAEKETLQQQLSAVKLAAEKTQAELNGRITGMDAELKQALEQRKSAEQHLSSVNEQLKQQKQTVEQAKAELNKQLEQLKQQAGSDKQAFEQQKAVLTKENEAIRQQLSQVKAQHAELQAKHSELADKHTKLQQHSDHRIGELKTALAAEQQQAVTAQQLKDAQANLAALKPQLQEAEQKLQQAAQQATLEKLLDDKLNALAVAKTEELNKAVGNIKNHVNTGLGNATKQLEAFMGIQTYLEKGIKPLSFHGWPISPDIGLYLTGLIDANNYDVIIEFGSGSSTVLMAKALVSKQRGNAQKVLSDNSKAGTGLALGEADYNDLPARIVTFEHNSKYHAQTLKALQDNGVDGLVDLVHAPLVDYQYKDGSQYLYYSCADKLAELAKVFKGRKANILVLVDGPPGATNKHARFPALPHLMNIMPGHDFNILMDDFNRDDEKEIIEEWKQILIGRFIKFQEYNHKCEKGLSHLHVFY